MKVSIEDKNTLSTSPNMPTRTTELEHSKATQPRLGVQGAADVNSDLAKLFSPDEEAKGGSLHSRSEDFDEDVDIVDSGDMFRQIKVATSRDLKS